MSTDDAGVIYLAFGYSYCIQSVRSACSLKSVHPELDISILTNIPLNAGIGREIEYQGTAVGPELFDEVIYVDAETDSNRQYKTTINEYSPYDRTLLLDCDTVVQRDIKQGFRFLNYADLAAVARPIPSNYMIYRWDGDIHVDGIQIEDSPTFYSGVLFFDTEDAAELFEYWNSLYNEYGYDRDQYSLVTAIYETDTEFLPLPVIWNTMDTDIQKYTGFDEEYDFQREIKIHHQNFPSYGRMLALKELEETVGEELLAVPEERTERLRNEFADSYNRLNAIRTEVNQSTIARLLYRKLVRDNPVV